MVHTTRYLPTRFGRSRSCTTLPLPPSHSRPSLVPPLLLYPARPHTQTSAGRVHCTRVVQPRDSNKNARNFKADNYYFHHTNIFQKLTAAAGWLLRSFMYVYSQQPKAPSDDAPLPVWTDTRPTPRRFCLLLRLPVRLPEKNLMAAKRALLCCCCCPAKTRGSSQTTASILGGGDNPNPAHCNECSGDTHARRRTGVGGAK